MTYDDIPNRNLPNGASGRPLPGARDVTDAWVAQAGRTEPEKVARVMPAATASSAHGEVTVSVDAAGQLADLYFSEQVRQWRSDDLAAEVVRLFEQACDRLVEKAIVEVFRRGGSAET